MSDDEDGAAFFELPKSVRATAGIATQGVPQRIDLSPNCALARVLARVMHHYITFGAWRAEGLVVEIDPVPTELWLYVRVQGVPAEQANKVASSMRAGGARIYSMAPAEVVRAARWAGLFRRMRVGAGWGLLPCAFAVPMVGAWFGPDGVKYAAMLAVADALLFALGALLCSLSRSTASGLGMRVRLPMPSITTLDAAARAGAKHSAGGRGTAPSP